MLYPKMCLGIKMATTTMKLRATFSLRWGLSLLTAGFVLGAGREFGVTLILNPLKLIIFFFLAAFRISFLSQLL